MKKESKIKIGTGKWIGYGPLYLAQNENLFKKNNVNVEIIQFSHDDEIINNFRNSQLDIVAVTLDMLLILNESGFPCKAILLLDFSLGADMIIANKGINNFNDIKGKKIGLEKQYISEYFLARALSENNLKPSDIEKIYIKPSDYLKVLKEKTVDAIVSYSPIAAPILQKGYKLIFSSKEIPSSIIDLLVTTDKIINKYPNDIIAIIKTWFDSLKFIDKYYNLAMNTMAKLEGLDEYDFKVAFDDIYLPNFDENLQFFNLESQRNIFKISDITQDFLIKKNVISSKINNLDIFEIKFLNKLKSKT